MEFDILCEVIAEILNVDPKEITPETTFVDDLGADSLDIFQIVLGVEEKLHIKLYDDESDDEEANEALANIKTVGDAVELIKKSVG
ncbi:MAG: acyl carrier protein [Lachnospiraceae bacterium]|nr:acyl carrier protein [Lachnospiraceae bacterium]